VLCQNAQLPADKKFTLSDIIVEFVKVHHGKGPYGRHSARTVPPHASCPRCNLCGVPTLQFMRRAHVAICPCLRAPALSRVSPSFKTFGRGKFYN
jgi:hypothetical protein